MKPYIYQRIDWPKFSWDNDRLHILLSNVRNVQGRLIGKMEALGFDLRNEAFLQTLTLDVLKSTEIEGEFLNPEQVRSSIARKLGMDISGLISSDRNVDGMVDMMFDATQNCYEKLSKERLCDWHSALFPTGKNGMYKINVGQWRTDKMEVVSGTMGKEKIHFQAPDFSELEYEMELFLNWINDSSLKIDSVIKSAIAHLWFVTIHPFDDGNGRITRAITDMLLSRSDGSKQRFYSMSAQIRIERKSYYEILEKTQKGDLDITNWIEWFLKCLMNALESTDEILSKIIYKSRFWQINTQVILNCRQQLIINKLLDGFDGKLTTTKWAKINKCSADTSLRDIQDLITKGIIRKELAGGRSTNYELCDFKIE